VRKLIKIDKFEGCHRRLKKIPRGKPLGKYLGK
jgi:hypothetical protein